VQTTEATDPNAASAPPGATDAASSLVPRSETLATFTENEVIGVMRVASADAIARAGFAQLRADDTNVKAFASKLIADHNAALDRLSGLRAPSTGPDPTSALVQREEQVVELDLQTQPNAASFELAYMTAQIGTAAKMIAMIDRSLLPSVATVRATRAAVLALRGMYVGHLVKALDIQQRVLRSALTAGTPDTAEGSSGNPGSSLRITPHK
jgi:predicted outer membrane protein